MNLQSGATRQISVKPPQSVKSNAINRHDSQTVQLDTGDADRQVMKSIGDDESQQEVRGAQNEGNEALEEEEEVNPCENFSLVAAGVYRSAFPKKKNFTFLKRLKLKSILTLILEDYPDQNKRFLEENNITLFQFGVPGNKEPFVDIPEDKMQSALSVIMGNPNCIHSLTLSNRKILTIHYSDRLLPNRLQESSMYNPYFCFSFIEG